MDSLTDSPSEEVIHSPSEIWTLPLEERKALLMKICGDIVESFVSFEYHSADDGSSSNDKVNAQKQFIFNYSLVTIYVTGTGLIAGVRNCSYSPFSSAKSIFFNMEMLRPRLATNSERVFFKHKKKKLWQQTDYLES